MPKMSSGNKKNAVYASWGGKKKAKHKRERGERANLKDKQKKHKMFHSFDGFFMLKHSDHDSSHNKTMLHRLVAFFPLCLCLFGVFCTQPRRGTKKAKKKRNFYLE